MKRLITSATIALSLLAAPSFAMHSTATAGVFTAVHQGQPVQVELVQSRRSFVGGTTRSTPRSRRQADQQTTTFGTRGGRQVFRNRRSASQGFSTQRTGRLSRAAQIANRIHNESAETSTDRRVIVRR
ncbi:MAG: hypothetical protein AAF366_04355 [Pseudomonadota bacterium]